MSTSPTPEVAVLVEGESDAIVVRELLRRAGVSAPVRPMAGVTNIDRWLARCATDRRVGHVAGLYDLGEERVVVRALRRRGLMLADDQPSGHGFFVCDADLEDELIRAVGPERAAASLSGIGLAGTFETFVQQPQWRGRPVADQLHRFAGAGSGRKARIAAHLTDLLTPDQVPAPLAGLVSYVAARSLERPGRAT